MLVLFQPKVHYYLFVYFQINYENTIEELQREMNQLSMIKQEVESEYSTLKRTVENKEEEGKRRQSMLEVRSLLMIRMSKKG